MRIARAAAILGGALAACSVDVDLAGKQCPCLPGWVCDSVEQICVRQDSASEGAFTIESFDADWATPNSIRWRWKIDGRRESFHAFEVVVGPSEEAVRERSDVVVWTAEINPELQLFSVPRNDGVDYIEGTITDQLTPSTDYYAQLVVIDTAQQSSRSPIVVKRTAPASELAIDLVTETGIGPGHWLQPECLELVSDAPYEGMNHYQYQHWCSSDETQVCTDPQLPDGESPSCWMNIQFGGIDVDATELTAGGFEFAYLEVALALVSPAQATEPTPAYYVQLRVDEPPHYWAPLSLRGDGEYRLFQIPLSAFGLTHEALAGTIRHLEISAAWPHGSTIRIDSARVRW